MNDVLIAYVRPDGVDGNFFDSWTDLLVWDLSHGQRIGQRIGMRCTSSGADLPAVRNQIVREALERPDWQWLAWVDTDAGFAPNTIDRLLASAHVRDRPILGALAFASKEVSKDGFNGFRTQPRPTIFDFVPMDDGTQRFCGRNDYPYNQVTRCASTGMHCVLIHRWVFEKLRDEFGDTWHDRIPQADDLLGEDTSFYARCGAQNIPVHVDTAIKTNHRKTCWVGEDDWIAYQTQSHPMLDLPEAVVAIPVKDRWDLTCPLLEELVTQGEASEIIVYDNGSTDGTREGVAQLARNDARISYVNASGWKLHGMWNRALEAAQGRPVAILNNDLKIGPEFLSRQVFALVNDPRLAVVSPNYDRRPGGVFYTGQIAAGRYDGTGGIAGFAFMVAADFTDYRFPEQLNWWYGDNHLIASALRAERKCAVLGGVTVEHIDGGGQTGGTWVDDPKYTAAIQADRDWFMRWLADQ